MLEIKVQTAFYGGWWREDLGGWFFRKSLLYVLENNGALKQNIKTEKMLHTLPQDVDVKHNLKRLEAMDMTRTKKCYC